MPVILERTNDDPRYCKFAVCSPSNSCSKSGHITVQLWYSEEARGYLRERHTLLYPVVPRIGGSGKVGKYTRASGGDRKVGIL